MNPLARSLGSHARVGYRGLLQGCFPFSSNFSCALLCLLAVPGCTEERAAPKEGGTCSAFFFLSDLLNPTQLEGWPQLSRCHSQSTLARLSCVSSDLLAALVVFAFPTRCACNAHLEPYPERSARERLVSSSECPKSPQSVGARSSERRSPPSRPAVARDFYSSPSSSSSRPRTLNPGLTCAHSECRSVPSAPVPARSHALAHARSSSPPAPARIASRVPLFRLAPPWRRFGAQ